MEYSATIKNTNFYIATCKNMDIAHKNNVKQRKKQKRKSSGM